MFIKNVQYGLVQAACGITLNFGTLRPKPIKIADISTSTRSDGISNLTLQNFNSNYTVDETTRILVQSAPILFNEDIPNIDSSYTGSFLPTSISEETITYYQNLIDLEAADCVGVLYLANNIEPSKEYIISFSVESNIPSSTKIDISPKSYTVTGNDVFEPITSAKIITKSDHSKILIKMTIRGLNNNKIIKTEYYEIKVSDDSNGSCQIISENDIYSDIIELNKNNNWTYNFQGYRLLKFIPYNDNDITVILPQKNPQLLPNRGSNDKLRIVVDPIKMNNAKVSIDQIRSAVAEKYSSIENIYAIANASNKSYDIIFDNKVKITNEVLADVVVATVPPVSGEEVKFSEVASAVPYFADLVDIPDISFVRYNNDFFGELQFNQKIYQNEPIKVIKNKEEYNGYIKSVVDEPTTLVKS